MAYFLFNVLISVGTKYLYFYEIVFSSLCACEFYKNMDLNSKQFKLKWLLCLDLDWKAHFRPIIYYKGNELKENPSDFTCDWILRYKTIRVN